MVGSNSDDVPFALTSLSILAEWRALATSASPTTLRQSSKVSVKNIMRLDYVVGSIFIDKEEALGILISRGRIDGMEVKC